MMKKILNKLGVESASGQEETKQSETVLPKSSLNIIKDRELDSSDCPICLDSLIYPCRLPCGHVFCFLCIKGTFNQNKHCALCRTEIPADYFKNPDLVRHCDRKEVLNEDESANTSESVQSENDRPSSEEEIVWFYEGRNGWWQYDERTNIEIETQFSKDPAAKFTLLIAGTLYIIDLEANIQQRLDDIRKKRRMKRDLKNIRSKKGVAGILTD